MGAKIRLGHRCGERRERVRRSGARDAERGRPALGRVAATHLRGRSARVSPLRPSETSLQPLDYPNNTAHTRVGWIQVPMLCPTALINSKPNHPSSSK